MAFIHRTSVCVVVGLVLLLSGCALVVPQSYASPKEVTLQEAFDQVACGLATYKNSLAQKQIATNGILDEVTVNFVVKASATGKSTLVIDSSKGAPGLGQLPLGVTYTDDLTQVGERTNNITVKFKHVYTADLNEPGKTRLAKEDPSFGTSTSGILAHVTDPCASRLPSADIEAIRRYGRGQ
jgi:hypothetical protein